MKGRKKERKSRKERKKTKDDRNEAQEGKKDEEEGRAVSSIGFICGNASHHSVESKGSAHQKD